MDHPNVAQVRRRKKRSSGGPIGSSLTGLRRNNIRVVELLKRSNGYGFTVSGQKPCILRSIIDGSPAALAGLRKGHCLLGVNGKEVTHLAHDDVVQLIERSTGFLRLHVAESYFSESSDDESLPPRFRSSASIPVALNRRVLRRDPATNSVTIPPPLRYTKVSPRRAVALGYCFPPTPPMKKTVSSSIVIPKVRPPPATIHCPSEDDFETDPNSMNEILGDDRNFEVRGSQQGKPSFVTRFSLNAIKQRQRVSRSRHSPLVDPEFGSDIEIPRPLEVSVIITSPRHGATNGTNEGKDTRTRRSIGVRGRISPNLEGSDGHLNSSALYPPMHQLSIPVSCARNGGTRSLDNLCSPDFLGDDFSGPGSGLKFENKGNIGSSTPSLHHVKEALKPIRDQFWEFKVPEAPKPETNQAKRWAESIEKLLRDVNGMEVFTEFLEREFSAENIHFYNACLNFKESYPNLTNSQRISVASTIFQKHLQNGATDPVNVDHQARSKTEKDLRQPTLEMFDLPLSQVFNLLKFDCYPRFLKSETYRDYVNGTLSTHQSVGEPTDSDADSVKSKLSFDGRRKSLLPWNIKSRSKKKQRNKNEQGLSSNVSFIEKAALSHGISCEDSDQDEAARRQSCKVCRVILPDNSTTVLPCKPGECLSTVVQRLLEKREFPYSAFEVVSISTGKAMDLNMDVSEITAREIKVEPRAFVGMELPLGWKVGVRANPARKMSEVLKPVLAQCSLKLDNIVIHDLETGQPVELKCPVGKVDGHNLCVETKGDVKSEEFQSHITEFPPSETHQFFDDDQLSSKTTSSQASSVFKDFLRRSSKKYKRETPKAFQQNVLRSNITTSAKNPVQPKNEIQEQPPSRPKSNEVNPKFPPKLSKSSSDDGITPIMNETEFHPDFLMKGQGVPKANATTSSKFYVSSPLSLIRSELNLTENSRNRKPIYVNQTIDKHSKS